MSLEGIIISNMSISDSNKNDPETFDSKIYNCKILTFNILCCYNIFTWNTSFQMCDVIDNFLLSTCDPRLYWIGISTKVIWSVETILEFKVSIVDDFSVDSKFTYID